MTIGVKKEPKAKLKDKKAVVIVSLCFGTLFASSAGVAATFFVINKENRDKLVNSGGGVIEETPKPEIPPILNPDAPTTHDELFAQMRQKTNDFLMENSVCFGQEDHPNDINNFMSEIKDIILNQKINREGLLIKDYFDDVIYNFSNEDYYAHKPQDMFLVKSVFLKFKKYNKYINPTFIKKWRATVYRDGIQLWNLRVGTPREWFKWDKNDDKKIVGIDFKYLEDNNGKINETRWFIPESCTKLGNRAFYVNDDQYLSMSEMYFSHDTNWEVADRPQYVFRWRLLEKVDLGSMRLTAFWKGMFADCEHLKNVIYNNEKVKEIGNSAFYRSGVEKVVLGENVKKIHANAFGFQRESNSSLKQANLKTLVLNKNLDYIHNDAFHGNDSIQKTIILNPNPDQINYGIGSENSFKDSSWKFYVCNDDVKNKLIRSLGVSKYKIIVVPQLNNVVLE